MTSRLTRIHVAVIFALGLSACSRNPVTGKREVILMSEEQELAISKESHPSIVATMGLYEDPKLQNFINEKGKAMGRISHRPNLPYAFHIVDSPVVNAFAVPGGHIYFTRGIMAHFNNEAEFAGVLGHEIGHVTARHSARQQSSQMLSTIGLIGGAILAPEVVGSNIEAFQQGLGLLMLKYSRAHESESDEIGVTYSSKIGYDATKMANFFGTMKRITDNSGQAIPEFMSTHPDPGNRFSRVQKLAGEYQAKNPGNYEVERERYLRMIDGIIYGEDPKQGFVEADMFYHPVLKFQFPVPRGWQHQNSPQQFQMAPQGGKAAMILMQAEGTSLDDAAQKLVQQLNLRVLENAKTTINGNPAVVLISQQQPQQQQGQPQQQQDPRTAVQIGTWLIQFGGSFYAMHGLAQANDFSNQFRTFQSVATNFRSLTDPDKLNRKPERVLIREAPREGTFRDVMAAFGVPGQRIEELAVLNSMQVNDRVARGTLLKIIGR